MSTIKQRHVLILSKKEYNNKTEDAITCGITSNLKDVSYSVLVDNKNLVNGYITVSSRIKVDKLFTISKNIIRNKVAKVNQEIFKQVREELFNLV